MTKPPHTPTAFSVWIQLKTIRHKNGLDTIRKAAVWAGIILTPKGEHDYTVQPLEYATGVPVYQEISRANSLQRQSIYAPSIEFPRTRRTIRTLAFMKASAHSSYRWKLAMILNGFHTLADAILIARHICAENRGPQKIISYTIAFADIFNEYKLYVDPKALLDYEPVYWRYVQEDGALSIETQQQQADASVQNNKENQVCVR